MLEFSGPQELCRPQVNPMYAKKHKNKIFRNPIWINWLKLTPGIRGKTENPCVGGSIPPHTTSFNVDSMNIITFKFQQVSATRMKKFWTMLAHYHGQQAVLSEIGKSLEVSHTTIKSYLDILTDFYMVRQLQPWAGNTKKRLVRSPKIYIRDTGLLHKLLNISTFESLLGNQKIRRVFSFKRVPYCLRRHSGHP